MVVGLIANPVSSKDIRRLVALGRVADVEEKANLVARFGVGVGAGPPTRVLALDDRGGGGPAGVAASRAERTAR